MVVKKISIGDDAICFEFDTDVQEIKIKAFSPAIREHIELGTYDAETEGCRLYIPRNAFGRDGLYLAYELYHRGEKLTGKSYAEEFTMTPENDYPYPPADTKKGL